MLKLQEILTFLGTATILQIDNELIHVKFKFSYLQLEDEFFFKYSPNDQLIHIQANPINYPFDFGLNKSRIEKIRDLIIKSNKT